MPRGSILAIKVILSGVLLYFAIDWTHIGTLGQRLSAVKPHWFAVMMVVQVVQLLLGAVRWREIVKLSDGHLSVQEAVRFTSIAAFFNQTLPSSVGGDAARIWLLARNGTGWARATYSVIVDRMVGVMVLSAIVILCLPWTLTLIRDPVGRLALLTIGFGSMGAILVFMLLGSIRIRLLARWPATRHLIAAATVANRLWHSLRFTLVILVLSASTHLLTALAAWCGAKAVDAQFDFLLSVFLVLPVLLVTVVPISIAGWGVRERAMTVAFAYAGLAQSDGLLISLLYGFSMFIVGAIGGLVWILSPNKPTITALTRET